MTSSNVNFYDDYCCSYENFVDEQNYRYQHHYSQRTVPAYRNVYAAEDEDDLHDLIVADGLSTDCRHHHYRGVLSQAADSSSATPPAIYSRDETTLPTKTSTTKRRQVDVDEASRNPRHRQAANIRERRRMRSINEAFEHLRRRIPTLPYEKRLSKVDTLKLAIGYIKFLHDLIVVNNVDGAESTRKSAAAKPVKRPQPPEAPPVKKIIIQCHAPEYRHARDVTGLAPLVGHSLSWNRPVETSARPVVSPDGNSTYLRAKVWTPTPKFPANSGRTPAVHDDPGPPELRPVDDYVTSEDLCYQMIRANV